MMKGLRSYDDVVEFHGHSCPGLAIGYRASLVALKEFEGRASDEELVAIVENDSCAVDAVQVMTGCTFGKGNLIFKDHGKQVFTFFERPYPEAVRISLKWRHPKESEEEAEMWQRYRDGDRSEDVTRTVHDIKGRKLRAILEADERELFDIRKVSIDLPPTARILPSVKCSSCGEMVMETRARVKDGNIICIPCMGEVK